MLAASLLLVLGFNHVAIVASVAHASQSSCQANEPCCFSDLSDGAPFDAFLTVKVAKVEWLKACLSAVRTLPKVAEGTVDGFRVGLLPMYSFTKLSMDSLNNDASLAEGMEVCTIAATCPASHRPTLKRWMIPETMF